MMSASHALYVTVRGQGGHGSAPHRGRDPIAAMAEMITSLQTMVTRRFDMFDPVVLTVGMVEGGTRRNIIPDTASFEATVRRFSEANAELLRTAIRGHPARGRARPTASRSRSSSRASTRSPSTRRRGRLRRPAWCARCSARSRYEDLPVPDRRLGGLLPRAGGGARRVRRSSARRCPAATRRRRRSNHSPRADFDPAVLPDAAAIYAALAVRRLESLRRT